MLCLRRRKRWLPEAPDFIAPNAVRIGFKKMASAIYPATKLCSVISAEAAGIVSLRNLRPKPFTPLSKEIHYANYASQTKKGRKTWL
jgi:hypothetical protein